MEDYLSFNVLMATSPRMIAIIQNRTDNPKPHDHLGFHPSLQFEMVMERGHLENPPFPELKGDHLHDDGDGFHYEYPAYDNQGDLVFRHQGQRSQGGSEGKGTRVPHEDLRWIGVKPEEPQARANQPPAEDG
jgi:hypothetical protein